MTKKEIKIVWVVYALEDRVLKGVAFTVPFVLKVFTDESSAGMYLNRLKYLNTNPAMQYFMDPAELTERKAKYV